ncbi:damage-control phosphatase ARMT1 family protein [Nitratifractor sp.]
MQMRPDCLVCLYEQMLRTGRAMGCDDPCAAEILHESATMIAGLAMEQTPPEAAALLYPRISELTGDSDPYAAKKRESTVHAREILPWVEERVSEAASPLDAALRAAVAGNVIDFATQVSFDLREEVEKIFEAPFAIDHKEAFLGRLSGARSLVLIGDNVGEHLFDRLLLDRIRTEYPDMEISYFVRGAPIINDVTLEDAREAGIDAVARIVDSGVDTPGFLYGRASEEARRIYDAADLILAKGMGNFECMDTLNDPRLFFLFKVKCRVVAGRIGREVGDLICLHASDLPDS